MELLFNNFINPKIYFETLHKNVSIKNLPFFVKFNNRNYSTNYHDQILDCKLKMEEIFKKYNLIGNIKKCEEKKKTYLFEKIKI